MSGTSLLSFPSSLSPPSPLHGLIPSPKINILFAAILAIVFQLWMLTPSSHISSYYYWQLGSRSVRPSFKGSLSRSFDADHIIRPLSRFVFVICQIEGSSPNDIPNGKAIQNGYALISLTGNEPRKTEVPLMDNEEISKHSPEAQVFFSYANFIINYMEIEDFEAHLFRKFAKIDIGPS